MAQVILGFMITRQHYQFHNWSCLMLCRDHVKWWFCQETPLPVYIGVMLHSATCKRWTWVVLIMVTVGWDGLVWVGLGGTSGWLGWILVVKSWLMSISGSSTHDNEHYCSPHPTTSKQLSLANSSVQLCKPSPCYMWLPDATNGTDELNRDVVDYAVQLITQIQVGLYHYNLSWSERTIDYMHFSHNSTKYM